MGWKPDMTDSQRERLNRSRRRAYAKARAKRGLPYNPRRDEENHPQPVAGDNSLSRLKELLEKAEKKNDLSSGDSCNNSDSD